jgi:chromosome segregation ATPase
MKKDKEDLYLLVREAIKKIRDRGDKPNGSSVVVEVKKRKKDVLRIFNVIMDQEKVEEEARTANAISLSIGEAIIKDRVTFATHQTESLREKIGRLEMTSDVLSEEIDDLQSEKEALENQLTSEQEIHAEKVASLVQSNSHQNGTLQSMQGQIDTLQYQLGVAQSKREEDIKKHLGLSATLVRRSEEAKAARSAAKKLRQHIEEIKTERDQAKVDLNASERTTERMQGQITALAEQLEKTRIPLSSATPLQINVEDELVSAKVREEAIQADNKPKSASHNTSKNASTKAKTTKEATPPK